MAITKGLGAAVIMVTGYLYMPLCACLSTLMFRRLYGWLEIHGLAFLTLTIMIFMERIARQHLLSEPFFTERRREFLVQVLAGSRLDAFQMLFGL